MSRTKKGKKPIGWEPWSNRHERQKPAPGCQICARGVHMFYEVCWSCGKDIDDYEHEIIQNLKAKMKQDMEPKE